MTLNDHDPETRTTATALERARLVSQALSDAARRARFSMRTRRRLFGGGVHIRRGDNLFRRAAWISFWLTVALPTTCATLYFGLIASDQYVAEFKFTVMGAEPAPMDTLSVMSGIPAISIIQDTQIVVNHLSSRAAIEALETRTGIRSRYADPSIDWYARFNPSKPVEKLVRYWTSMIDASIKLPAGIVEVKVRAFRPDDALMIARSTLSISEDLINDMNDRMNRDTIATAESELERAKARLTKARFQLEKARNEEGLLDVRRTAEGLGQLLTDSRRTLLNLQQEYNAQTKAVSEQAPQMRALRARINAATAQIADLEAKVTKGAGTDPLPEATLSRLMTRFSELDLEKQIAERLYDGAITALEVARISAERKIMYLRPFVLPTLPEEAAFPRRRLNVFLTFIGSLVAWGALLAGANLVRNHMA